MTKAKTVQLCPSSLTPSVCIQDALGDVVVVELLRLAPEQPVVPPHGAADLLGLGDLLGDAAGARGDGVGHPGGPLVGGAIAAGEAVEVLPAGDAAEARVLGRQLLQDGQDGVEVDVAVAVGRVGELAHDHLLGWKPIVDDVLVVGRAAGVAPPVVELPVVEGDRRAPLRLQVEVVEPA